MRDAESGPPSQSITEGPCCCRYDRGVAKLRMCHPDILQRLGQRPDRRFAVMCSDSWETVYGPRLKEGRLIRNDRTTCSGAEWFGCWWTALHRPEAAFLPGDGDGGGAVPGIAPMSPAPPSKSAASPPSERVEPKTRPRGPPPAPPIRVHIVYANLKSLNFVVSMPGGSHVSQGSRSVRGFGPVAMREVLSMSFGNADPHCVGPAVPAGGAGGSSAPKPGLQTRSRLLHKLREGPIPPFPVSVGRPHFP